jgi:hypothetical protein
MKPVGILHGLNAQYGEETLSRASVYDWYSTFSEGRKEVSNLPHALVQHTAVRDVNIRSPKELIWGNSRITVCDIAAESESLKKLSMKIYSLRK